MRKSVFAVAVLATVFWSSAFAKQVELSLGEGDVSSVSGEAAGVSVVLHYDIRTDVELGWGTSGKGVQVPVAEVFDNRRRVAVLDGEASGLWQPPALAQIVEMDPANAVPEVLLSTYTGGAHCCNALQIATRDPHGTRWRRVEVGSFDGGPSGAEDIDGDGVYEILQYDNRFLYRFSSYAESVPPLKILKLEGRRIMDRSSDPTFRFKQELYLKDLEQRLDSISEDIKPNPLLAAFVATKARLGAFDEAWSYMLDHYDRNATWDLDECIGGYDANSDCRKWKRYSGFPDALKSLLLEGGYIAAP